MASAAVALISQSGDNATINIHGGTYNQAVVTNSRLGGFELLVQNVAAKARYDAGDVADPIIKCHPDTRVAILTNLEEWAEATTYNYPIKWVRGSAGVGKTTIMRTMAEILAKRKLLLASFFFWRTADRCNSAKFLIATLAYQIAISIPETRKLIERAIEENPLIFDQTLEVQSRDLIITPLNSTHLPSQYPRIFVIDGLDECESKPAGKQFEMQAEVLRVLHSTIQQLPTPFAILIASRPEIHLQRLFNTSLKDVSSSLLVDDSCDATADIEKFYSDKFREIREHHPLKAHIPGSNWPSETIIHVLLEKSSGQFIYASTVTRFIAAARKNPCQQLEIILEGQIPRSVNPFQSLDLLYSTVLSTIDNMELGGTLRILGSLLAPLDSDSTYLPSVGWDCLLGLEPGGVRRLLLGLESLLSVGEPEKESNPKPTTLFDHDWNSSETMTLHKPTIRFYHKSLAEFLFDPSRSGSFFIDKDLIFEDLAKQCIPHLFASNGIILEFIFYNVVDIFRKAKPTKELLRAIKQCPTRILNQQRQSLMNDTPSAIPSLNLTLVYPEFLKAITNSKFQEAWSLFNLQSKIYKRAVNNVLQLYFKDESLVFLILTSLVYPRDTPGVIDTFNDFIDHVWPLSQESKQIDQEEGFLLYQNKSHILDRWHDFAQTARDLTAKEAEAENWFAIAASRLVRCMCPSSEFYTESSRELGIWGIYTMGHSIAHVLPVFLARASIESDLGQYLRDNPISEEYLGIPRIKFAIDEYLLRVEESSRFGTRIHTWISRNLKGGAKPIPWTGMQQMSTKMSSTNHDVP